MSSREKSQLPPHDDEKNIQDVAIEGVGSETLESDPTVDEKAFVRKLDFRILPIACVLYFCSCESSVSLLYPRIS